jgi:hypothetical protein
MVTLESQIDSLVAVTLQSQREIDLTAEKDGFCLFLEKGYYFYVDQLSLVRKVAKS